MSSDQNGKEKQNKTYFKGKPKKLNNALGINLEKLYQSA